MKYFTLFFFIFQFLNSQTRTVGLISRDTVKSLKGYTLFSPIPSNATYLIDNEGNKIQTWVSQYRPGQSVMLLQNGDLLRTATPGGQSTPLNGGGAGGIVEKFDWNGNLIWTFNYYTSEYRSHHDIEILPNGNILLIVWVKKTTTETITAGRNSIPQNVTEIWSEKIIEVKQTGINSGEIVWEWHAWDHLIQDANNTKPNFGVVQDHPELIDINSGGTQTDWLHINSIRYNSSLDEIILSVHNLSEIWIIDHSTTTLQAASHTGGKRGKGGDLLYRWGNPRTYKRGSASDQKLFLQHDARWIDSGFVGAGNILIFNNGQGRPGGNYSSVEEIIPPVNTDGSYSISSGTAFGPLSSTWNYTAQNPIDFYGQNISGATRLLNGNTLACVGPTGIFLELTQDKKIVWKYINPVTQNGVLTQGQTPSNNMVFKIYRYSPNYSAFAGKTLTSKGPIENYSGGVDDIIPKKFALYQNFPNPFNPSTTINYGLPEDSKVTIEVYNSIGQKVATLVNEIKNAGYHSVVFNYKVDSGIFFYRIFAVSQNNTNKNFINIKKMMLLK